LKPLVIDALASGKGERRTTLDVIGAGPRAICGVLEKNKIDPYIERADNVIRNPSILSGFDTLFVSGMTNDEVSVRKVISQWKENSHGPVVLGGPITSDPFRILNRTNCDVAVVGEGEITLERLIETGLSDGILPSIEELSGIRGIAYKIDNIIEFTSLRPFMPRKIYNSFKPSTDVIPYYPLFRASRVYVEILRGCSNYRRARIGKYGQSCINCEECSEGELRDRYYCPQDIPPGCGYCSVPSLFGPPKSREVNSIYSEIRELIRKGVHRIVFSAPGFLDYGRDLLVAPEPLTDPTEPEPNYELIEELLSKITSIKQFKRREASLIIENMKASLVTARAAEVLGRYLSGTPVSIGFETGSEWQSRIIGRPSTPSQVITAIDRLSRVGMKPYVYFIHGLPGQSEETVEETIKAIKQSVSHGAERIILYRFRSLPMSAFESEPSGPPAVKNILSKRIVMAAKKANLQVKEELLGQNLRVVIAERYDKDPSYHVAYPLYHGPVVLIEDEGGYEGEVVNAKITEIRSDRLVVGVLKR
jgi:radical SAM superfamily enzyme YgiQ (UPF0313 family)